jgi:hypothetical protein
MSHFDKLLDELDAIRARRAEARELSDMASGNNAAGREFQKSLAAINGELTALAPKPRRTVLVVRKDAPEPTAGAETIAKAFNLLQHGDLSPAERGQLMLSLSGLTDRVLAKAMPSGAERAAPHSARDLSARLKEIKDHLDSHAEASHLAEAERLLDSAQKMIANPESMSMGDHAALSIQLDDLRHKIGSKRDAKR